MAFDPHSTRYPYTEYTDQHYLHVDHLHDVTLDENYPYIDNSKEAMKRYKSTRFLLHLIVWPLTRIKLGLRIKGRKNLRKHKEELSNGAISIANHVNLWDFLAVLRAVKPHKPYILVWHMNVIGKDAVNIRKVGGIPVPDTNLKAKLKFMEVVENHLNNGGWLHIYPEGSMWEYYQPIRPFKRGAAHFALKCDKPILPLAFSYRKPGWIRKHLFKQDGKFTLNIGEPIYKNKNLTGKEQETDLLKRCHEAVCMLSGILPEENIYPPIFDNTKRIDY